MQFRPAQASQPSLTLTAYWLGLLGRSYKVVALTTVVGLTAAYVFSRSQTPQYRATATLEIQDLNADFLNLKEVSQVSPFAQASAANDIQTQLRILQSTSLLARTLDTVPAEEIPLRQGTPQWVARLFPVKSSSSNATEEDKADARLARAAQNLQVREARQARIVDVTYESPDPAHAAAFVNSLVRHYIDQSIERRLEISQGTSHWLEQQLAEARVKVADSEHRLQDYAQRYGLLVTNQDYHPEEEKFRQIQGGLSRAQEDRAAKQARLETAASAPVESLDVPLGSAIREYQAKLADLRRQRADLLIVFTPDFEGTKRLDAQIEALELSLRTESAALLRNIQNQYLDAVHRERLLNDSQQQQFSKVTEQAGIAIQFGILKREVDADRDIYNTILLRTAEAKVASALRASGARIVDPAKRPRLPFRPNMFLNLAWGGTAGLLIGLVLVTARAKPSHLNAASNVAYQLALPELGAMPLIRASSQLDVEVGLVRVRLPEPISGAHVAMMTWNNRSRSEAASFRAILASILLSRRPGHTPQVIVVASAKPGEGRTTLVTNLAASISQMGRTALLVDASPDHKLHRLFNQPCDSDLRDVLEIPGDNSNLLPYLIHKTSWPGISLVVADQRGTGALDLLYSRGMESLLVEMRRTYDVVLADPPALEEAQDARILARMSDGVVLVVRPGEKRLQAARATSERLQDDGAIVLGTVFNEAA